MKKLICAAAAMLLVFMPATVQAWGPEGHQIVGTLAEAMLSNTAKAGVQSILGRDACVGFELGGPNSPNEAGDL